MRSRSCSSSTHHQALSTAHSSADGQWHGIHRQRLAGVECRERLHTAYIPPGSPWEKPVVESFNSRFRDEFLNIELCNSVQETKLLAEQHRIEYNTYRPHSAF